MLSEKDELEYLELLEQDARDRAGQNLFDFTLYTMPNFKVNWHHKVICQKLTDFANGKIKRLMIFAPPRHTKSELSSRKLPAFIIGRNPSSKVIITSYSQALSGSLCVDTQRLMDSPAYKQVFPDVLMNDENGRKYGNFKRTSTEVEFITNEKDRFVSTGGSIRATGTGGALTGLGANFIIIDDIVKNQQEADSRVFRERAYKFYRSTLYTRQQKDCGILLLNTRWHEDDLSGRLLRDAKADPSADQWEVITLPAIAEEVRHGAYDIRKTGEALWSEEYPVESLTKLMKSVGTRVSSALYQQRPSPEGGGLVKTNWFRYWQQKPTYRYKIISVDAAFKGNDDSDFVVMQAWGIDGADNYLLDQVRGRMGFTETVRNLKVFCYDHLDYDQLLIEEKANGAAIIDVLKSTLRSIIPINPKDSKVSRVNATSPQIEAGNVIIPDPAIFPWVNEYLEEWAFFPNGVNDDQIDTTTQVLLRLRDNPVGVLTESDNMLGNTIVSNLTKQNW